MAKETKPYEYFDSPDGEDVDKKLLCVMKPATLTALGLGTFDVLAFSHPKGYMSTLGRYAYIGFPVVGTSATFVLVSNAAASLRKKDDVWNWFIGGFASGTIMGAWAKRTIIGFNCGMLFGILGVFRKIAADNGWVVTPPDDNPRMNQGAWDFDFSLTKDRPGNWARSRTQE